MATQVDELYRLRRESVHAASDRYALESVLKEQVNANLELMVENQRLKLELKALDEQSPTLQCPGCNRTLLMVGGVRAIKTLDAVKELLVKHDAQYDLR